MTDHKWDTVGVVGSILGVGGPAIDALKTGFQITTGICGLVLVLLSIRHKVLEIKKLRRDGKRHNHRGTSKKD